MPLRPLTRTLTTFCLALLLSGAAAGRVRQDGGITVEDYCRLTQSLMELSVREWEQRAELAAAGKEDRKALAAKFEAVTKQYRPLREEVYARHGLTPKEDLRYASEHRAEIESYLEENPDVRDALVSLKVRIDALIAQVESAAPAPPPEGAQR